MMGLNKNLLVSLVWLVILVFTSYASFYLRTYTDSLLLYLPTALSIILIQWYGYRILPVIYINSIATLVIWRAEGPWWQLMVMGTHEPLVAATSRFLTHKFGRLDRSDFLENTTAFVRFIILGIMIPVAVNSIYVYNYSFVGGDLEKVALLWLSDFITIFSLSLPFLYFVAPADRGFLELKRVSPFSAHDSKSKAREFLLIVFSFIVISFFVPYNQYWFIYGIVAMVVGIRHGFESVLLINATIFLLNYILPLVENSTALVTSTGSTQLINVHLGNATMLFVSTLVARIINDLRKTEKDLIEQKIEIEVTNRQLKQRNQELDRFVYSVSHDLSAPLKSIQGLINISRMENSQRQPLVYLDMMQKSTQRLENFIGEVLDYSKTNRKEIVLEQTDLSDLFNDVREKFAYIDEYRKIKFDIELGVRVIQTDQLLIKSILSNLVSNAIKFQKKYDESEPFVKLKTWEDDGHVFLQLMDSGEGISEASKHRIFEMFYRGTSQAHGSGLGLYIAQEAAQRLGGKITVVSEYGVGSTFTTQLPVNH